jgi:hypothetical protein
MSRPKSSDEYDTSEQLSEALQSALNLAVECGSDLTAKLLRMALLNETERDETH